IEAQGSSSVLFDVLDNHNYKFAAFSGDNFDDPLYSEIIFRGRDVMSKKATYDDQSAIQAWSDWVQSSGRKGPWFNFIELTTLDNFSNYDSVSDPALSTDQRLAADYQKSAQAADNQLAT
ncbi:hydrolase, partial [Vibrio sp. 10N.222.55.E8]